MSNKETMIKKLGSEEAYRTWMSDNARKSHKTRDPEKRPWGYSTNPENAREAQRKSVLARRRNVENRTQN